MFITVYNEAGNTELVNTAHVVSVQTQEGGEGCAFTLISGRVVLDMWSIKNVHLKLKYPCYAQVEDESTVELKEHLYAYPDTSDLLVALNALTDAVLRIE